MKRITLLVMVIFLGSCSSLTAQERDTPLEDSVTSKWVVAGSVGLGGSFGSGSSSSTVALSPKIGYWLDSKVQVGLATNFIWQNSNDFSSTIFGFGPYLNYFVVPNFYLSTGFQPYFINQKNKISKESIKLRESALLVGLGYAHPIAKGAYFQLGGQYNLLYKKESSVFASGFTPTIGVVLGL